MPGRKRRPVPVDHYDCVVAWCPIRAKRMRALAITYPLLSKVFEFQRASTSDFQVAKLM